MFDYRSERRNGIKGIIPGVFVLVIFSSAFLQEGCFSRGEIKSVATESTEVPERRHEEARGTTPNCIETKKVYLKSISFNYDPSCKNCDAINIRMNPKKRVRIPEWKKGKKSYPAAYIIDKNIIIKAVFSGPSKVSSASIMAKTKNGELGDCESEVVSFKNGKSKPVCFRVSGKTPTRITSFDQEWDWFCSNINGTDSVEERIDSSKNKIYILLDEPKYFPWGKERDIIPWADALEYSCKWAEGAKNQTCAVTKITQALYNKVGAYYQKLQRYTVNELPETSFNLEKFLKNISLPYGVGAVNCYDMAKALVTFANALGCNVRYDRVPIKGNYYKCIKPVGLSNYCLESGVPLAEQCLKPVILSFYCCEYFVDHAYGLLGDKVFDPTFKTYKENQEKWLTNLPLKDYFNALLYEGGTLFLKMKRNPALKKDVIIESIAEQKGRLFFQVFFEKGFKFFDVLKDKKVIPGIKIDCRTFKDIICDICKYNHCESFRFISTDEIEASVIHKVWYTDSELLDITIIVSPYSLAVLKNFSEKLCDSTEISSATAGAKIWEGYRDEAIERENILLGIKVGGDLKEDEIFSNIVNKLYEDLKAQPLVDRSELIKKFKIALSPKPPGNKKESRVSLCLEVKKNEAGGEVHCFWRTHKGYIEKNEENDFFYFSEEAGKHCIKVIAVNQIGLLATDELDIKVEAH